jgi:hypothetical protein
LVETCRSCFGLAAKIRKRERVAWGKSHTNYEISFSSVRLAKWLQEIGVTPRKSLTLGALAVPHEFVVHTIRGLLDGDGSVSRYRDRRGRHCFYLYFYSASKVHLQWVAATISTEFGLAGSLATLHRSGEQRNPMYQLSYSRTVSRKLAALLYADPSAPRLARKWQRWEAESRLIAA